MALSDRRAQRHDNPDELRTGSPCSIGDVYRALADRPDEIAELNALLYEDGLSGAQVWEDLTNEGYKVGAQTPNRHRGRNCRCFKYENWVCKACRYDKAHCICANVDAA